MLLSNVSKIKGCTLDELLLQRKSAFGFVVSSGTEIPAAKSDQSRPIAENVSRGEKFVPENRVAIYSAI